MKKQIVIIPDKEIELSHGDYVKVYVKKNKIEFFIYCNGDGCVFNLTKQELKNMIK